MDALEPVLRPLVGIVNRRIRESTAALDICRRHAGRIVAVRVANSALAAYTHIAPDGLQISGPGTDDPDVVISGSLLSLAALGGADPQAPIRDGRVALSGDAVLAGDLQTLLGLAKPDLEEEAARWLGDGPAHQLGEIVQRLGEAARRGARTISETLGEALSRRSDAPQQDEQQRFTADVRTLRDDTARLEARIRRLQRDPD